MTRLYKVYETEYAFFLLIEHASGGRLWSYVSQFIQTSPCSPSRELHCPTRKLISPIKKTSKHQDSGNIYSGKMLLTREAVDGPAANGEERAEEMSESEYLKISMDADLCADTDFASSYVQLFTNISLHPTDGNFSEDIEKSFDKPATNSTEGTDPISSDIFVPEPQLPRVVDDLINPQNKATQSKSFSGNLEADDLISNARELLTNVGQTLEKSRSEPFTIDDNDEELSIVADSIVFKKSTEHTKPRSLSLTTSSRNKRRSSFKVTEPFSSPDDTPIRRQRSSSAYGGSLENLSHNHNRCSASAIFKQLDEINQITAVYLPEKCVKSWAAEIVTAISNLHVMGIVCRYVIPNSLNCLCNLVQEYGCVDRRLTAAVKPL